MKSTSGAVVHWIPWAPWVLFVPLVLILSLAGCTCSRDQKDQSDASDLDSGTDTDADTDTDTDADTGTDTDSDTLSDAGPWEWTDLPASEDCGPGCSQLTYGGGVQFREWDVWDDHFVYNDLNNQVYLVDIVNRKQLAIPAPVADCIIGPDGNCFGQYPSIYQDKIYYGLFANSPHRSILVHADFQNHVQELLYSTIDTGEDSWETIRKIDAYGDRIVSQGGCDNSAMFELCYFLLSSPGEVSSLDGTYYGGYASLWGDVAIWSSLDYAGDSYDVEGYNFTSSESFYVTHDTEIQLESRIQSSTVAYMDLRFGDSDILGNWNHGAIFTYDLSTHVTKQITSGDWVAAYPDVYDNIVIWSDFRASSNPNSALSFDGVEIWGYNLTTETEFQITNLPGRPKQTPRIWGDKVFVHMSIASGGDGIYMFDLSDGAK